ncbi:hypothetical protein K438DRAFT_1960684 [Mycena galopus ATCC 62051]|nr:hypothetical protein K438DRAFT_1960684 [Mycena galopus ATCC 62051]
MYSKDSAATANFTFTGVDVYYLAPRWPYDVHTQLSFDGGAPVLVNLIDPNASGTSTSSSETVNSSVAWWATNLANTSHSVLVTFGTYAIVDGFIYTVDNGASPVSSTSLSASSTSISTSTSISISTSASSVPSAASTSSLDKRLVIGLAAGLSIAVLIVVTLTFCVLYQRRSSLGRPTPSTQFGVDDSGTARAHSAVSPFQQMASVPDGRVKYQSPTGTESSVSPYTIGSTGATGSSRYTSGKSPLQNNTTSSGAIEPPMPPPYYSV